MINGGIKNIRLLILFHFIGGGQQMDNNMQNNNGPQNFNQMNAGPQNFNNQIYSTPPQMNNKQPNSGLGIAALILSILGCTFLIGAILAIVDITKKDGKNKLLSKISLGICGFWLLIGIIGSLGKKGDNKDNTTEMVTESITDDESVNVTEEALDTEEVSEDDEKAKLQEELKDKYSLIYNGEVRNDNTGNWRYSGYTENDSQETFASEYYKAFFEDDKEIHAVINFTNKTTAKLAVVGEKIDVTIYEYVDGEEHDAKELFSGDVLKQYFVNISDGSVEDILEGQNNEETLEESADYVLTADETGEYGRIVTLNANTDMPVDKYLYKIPAGKYKVTTDHKKLAGFSIVKDEIGTEDTDYPEVLQYVETEDGTAGYQLTAGDDDFNGHAKQEVFITIGEDESISIPGDYTTTVKFYFYKQQ